MQCSTVDELEEALKKEKSEDPNKIPYRFTILEMYPQNIILGYIPKEKLIKEYIKVKPKGFYFHQIYHNPFSYLINWFKEHFKEKDYQKEMKKVRSPRVKQVSASD